MSRKRHQSIVSLPKIATLVIVALIATLTIDFGRRALDNYYVQRQVEWLKQEVAREEDENQALQERLEYVNSDAYVEKVARENLKMVEPGDTAVVVVSKDVDEPATSTPVVPQPGQEEAEPYWQQWWDVLFGD